MTYVFDIDGTLCNNTNGEYDKAVPFKERIEHVNWLYSNGNRIIIFTARGMKRFVGDTEKCHRYFYEFTYSQLQSWGLNFHQLRMGKPEGDIFIDDKGESDENYFRTNIRG